MSIEELLYQNVLGNFTTFLNISFSDEYFVFQRQCGFQQIPYSVVTQKYSILRKSKETSITSIFFENGTTKIYFHVYFKTIRRMYDFFLIDSRKLYRLWSISVYRHYQSLNCDIYKISTFSFLQFKQYFIQNYQTYYKS